MSMRSLWTAATGMSAQQTNMDVIANNLANANTTALKAAGQISRTSCIRPPSRRAPTQALAQRCRPAFRSVWEPGLRRSKSFFNREILPKQSNTLDLAIQGNGFFKVLQGNQDVYTRAGSFKDRPERKCGRCIRKHAAASNHHTADSRYYNYQFLRYVHCYGRYRENGA